VIWLYGYLAVHILATLTLIVLILWPPRSPWEELQDHWIGLSIVVFLGPVLIGMFLIGITIKCQLGYHVFKELYFWDMYSIRRAIHSMHKLDVVDPKIDIAPGIKVHQCEWCNAVKSTSADSAV
jgi:hypothetical protein